MQDMVYRNHSVGSREIFALVAKNDRLGARVESALKPVPPLKATASNISQLLTVVAR